MINSKITVFLQTASAYIFYDSSKGNYAVKILLIQDPSKLIFHNVLLTA